MADEPVATHGLTHVALGVRDLALAFARDPDGYLIEIWYEIPTPVDPR
ncbi:MAG TPA: hypothetical protein VFT29_05825 [Gemmatimonadaceae bacterium]|nr:hypothetical protein [Gemmatimonadaceae bacterium]